MIRLVLETHEQWAQSKASGFRHVRKARLPEDIGLADDHPSWYNDASALEEQERWILRDECHELLNSLGVRYSIAWEVIKTRQINDEIEIPRPAWVIDISDASAATLFKLTFI